ncbi:MAG TPA: DUF423 domain-containing protein [candidate division Zixibacteria bacterium]|nr:DUF423 domain-containing protein [candidate division Zixibacteria bacterium]
MEKTFAILGAALMVLGVGAGAFGAHALESYFEEVPRLEATYQTAVRYHLIHGLALFAVAWVAGRWPGNLVNVSGYLIVAGIFLFSGSLYLLSLTDVRWLGAITPLGGVAFIAGWILLALAVWRG